MGAFSLIVVINLLNRRMGSRSQQENLPPIVVKAVAKELSCLSKDDIDGIKGQFDDTNLTFITVFVDGPEGTPFEGGVFKINLSISKDYPHSPPKGHFVTKVFHPNVNEDNGEICVNTLKKDWSPTLGIKHILLTIRCLLINPNPESALNTEAGKLLLENYDQYFSRAKMMTEVHAFPETKMKQLLFPSLVTNTTDKENNGAASAEGVLTDSSNPNLNENTAGPSAAKQHKSTALTNPSEKARLKAIKEKKRLLKRL